MSEIIRNSLTFNFLWFSVLQRFKKLKSNVISTAGISQENYCWVKKEDTLFLSPPVCRTRRTIPRWREFDFSVTLRIIVGKMYAPLRQAMLKQPHNNAFLKGSFYNLLDVSLIKKHIYLLGFFFLEAGIIIYLSNKILAHLLLRRSSLFHPKCNCRVDSFHRQWVLLGCEVTIVIILVLK